VGRCPRVWNQKNGRKRREGRTRTPFPIQKKMRLCD